MNIEKLMEEIDETNKCHRDVARNAKNMTSYNRLCELTELDGNVATETETISVYKNNDSAIFFPSDDSLPGWTSTRDDVADITRRIMEGSDYILTYLSSKDSSKKDGKIIKS